MNSREPGPGWKYLRPFAVGAISLLLVAALVSVGIRYVLSHYVYPVDADDNTPIQVDIPSGSSASKIASILYNVRGEDEKGLIVSTASFKVYVDFIGKANALKAGSYVFSRNMSIAEIVDRLCIGSDNRTTLRFTVPEGYTVEDIALSLERNSIIEDKDTFLNLCRDGSFYGDYAFIDSLGNQPGRRYALEGYLFPDTYELYEGASCDEIIRKMLDRFAAVYTDAYAGRAQVWGFTMDQLVTLASIIEREAALSEDFNRVSAVFHNRLSLQMPLESCATLSYALRMNKLRFDQQEIETVSPYNSYKNKGLPQGPICSPGKAALEAALYPSESYMKEGYLYFCNGNLQESRALLFSKSYEEHQKKVEQYAPFWN